MAIMMGDSMTNGASVGSVLFVGSGPVLAQDQSNLFWDNTNKRLGIGTTSPNHDLTVRKSVSSGAVRIDAINTNTASGANAQVTVSVTSANAGDAVMIYEVSGGMSWIVGLDNSESQKFKIASNVSSVVNTRLAVTTDGKVGVNVNDPTAQLHLAAGLASAGTAPLKLSAGTLMTAPEAGALEFDGADLFLTMSNGRRRFLTSHLANVLDFGAKGDGTTDDAQSVKDAVASLVATGGVVWFPPHLIYRLNSSIDIRSFFPIWILSEMGHGPVIDDFGAQGPALGKGYIKVGAPISNGIFRWRAPLTGATYPEEAGGGGMRHIHILDEPLNIPNHLGRNHAIDAAVYVEGAIYFMIDDCWFSFLKGTAIKVGRVTACRINFGRIYRCGDTIDGTIKPSVHVFGDGIGGYGAARIFDLVLEASHKAPSIKIEPGTTAIIQRVHFKANAGEPELQESFVHCSAGCALLDNGFGSLGDNVTQVIYDGTGNLPFQRISGNAFAGIGTALVMGADYSQADISGNFFNGSGSTSNIDAVTINGQNCKLVNNRFFATGRINLPNNRAEFLNNSVISCTAPSGSALVVCGAYGLIKGNFFEGGTQTAVTAIKGNVGSCQISDNFIRGLNNATGIDTSAAVLSNIFGNHVIELNGGRAILPGIGDSVRDNFGHPDHLVYSNTVASAAISNTALETAFDQFYTIPANRLQQGNRITICGCNV